MSSIIDKITTVANWLTALVPNLDSLVQLYDADFDSVEYIIKNKQQTP